MPVEFIGMIGTRPISELDGPTVSITGGSVDPAYVRNFAQIHEDGGWQKARSILSRIKENRAAAASGIKPPGSPYFVSARPQAVGSQRLLKFAAESEIHDKRLWTPIAAATGAYGNTTALVGTPEQVAESLVDYYEAGVTTLLIRGFDPVEDAIAYGRDVIPLVRAEVRRREQQLAALRN